MSNELQKYRSKEMDKHVDRAHLCDLVYSCEDVDAHIAALKSQHAEDIELYSGANKSLNERIDLLNGEHAEELARLAAENERLRAAHGISHSRYEKLRRLNVQQFADLFKRHLHSSQSFDSMVDEL